MPDQPQQPQTMGQPMETGAVQPAPPMPAEPVAPTISMPPSTTPSPATIAATVLQPLGIKPAAGPETPNSPQSSTPAASPAQPVAPGPVQPGSPSPAAYGVGTMGSAPSAAASGSSRTLLFAGIAAVVLVLGGGGAYLFVASLHHISAADIADAQRASKAITSDLNDITDALNNMDVSSTNESVKTNADKVSAKVADAQKQYKLLTSSHVQRSTSVKKQFVAVSSKWPGYANYVADNASDIQTLQPVLGTFEQQANDLTKQSPSSISELSSYLSKYKSLLDAASSKIGSLHMKITENQQVITAMKTFLGDSADKIGTAQRDVSANNLTAVENDLIKIIDSGTTFDSSLNDIEGKITAKENQLDPFDQFDSLRQSIDKLQQSK